MDFENFDELRKWVTRGSLFWGVEKEEDGLNWMELVTIVWSDELQRGFTVEMGLNR